MTGADPLIKEESASALDLRRRLDAFYGSFTGYPAFVAPNSVPYFWPILASIIRKRVEQGRSPCRLLEIGSGRTGFPMYLKECGLRDSVHVELHDITTQNRDWLTAQGDGVQIGPVDGVQGEYDVVFSTFVLEHMTDPSRGLARMWELLVPGGCVVVLCPRYDVPFYLPPSFDHLGRLSRFLMGLRVIGLRVRTRLTGAPAFRLMADPALFHLPWTKDRDAVHLASLYDFEAFFRTRGARLSRLRLPRPMSPADCFSRGALKDWLVKRLLTVSLCAVKPA